MVSISRLALLLIQAHLIPPSPRTMAEADEPLLPASMISKNMNQGDQIQHSRPCNDSNNHRERPWFTACSQSVTDE